MKNTTCKFTSLSFALLILSSPLVKAADDDTVPTQKVRFFEADLQSTTGNKIVYSLLRQAAGSVCGNVDQRDLLRVSAHKQCVNDAIARAVRTINNPRLSAYASILQSGGAPLTISSNTRGDTPR